MLGSRMIGSLGPPPGAVKINLVQPRLAAPTFGRQPARALDTPCKHLVPGSQQ